MYYRAWRKVLEHIKQRFMDETGLTEQDFFCEGEIDAIQETFYLRDMKNNLIAEPSPVHQKEFSSGKSVLSTFRYLASSYAMAFNLLGNNAVRLIGNRHGILPGTYRITYKKTLRALKSKNAFVTIDGALFSEDGTSCLCMEMKMLEWFVFKVNPIKDTFMEADNYYFPDTAPVFIETIQMLVPFLNRDGWEHFGSFQNCDEFLIMRQLLGIYNVLRMEKESRKETGQADEKPGLKQLTLASVYWSAKNPDCYGHYRERILKAEKQMKNEMRFLREIIQPVRDLFEDTLGVALQVIAIDHRELLAMLDKTPEERRWLERYEI